MIFSARSSRSPVLVALLGLLGLGAIVLSARAAAADPLAREDREAREVWIDARPWTCVHEAGALARDAELACDALGGRCKIAGAEASATQRAVLVCESPTRWTLRIETMGGRPVVSVALTGDHEERIRKAAMWIARVEDEGPVEAPPAAAAPADAPAPPSGRGSRPAPPLPPASHFESEPDLEDKPAASPLDDPPKIARKGGLALDAAIGTTNSNFVQTFRSLHGSVAYAAGPFHVGGAGTYEQAFSNGPLGANIGRVGARAGWGAPFSDRIVGLWLESGVAWGTRGTSFGDHAPADFLTPYGRAEVMLQLRLNAPVRPYVAAAGTFSVDQFGETVQTALVSAGLAWRAW